MLDLADISNTYIYSNLDPSARKINAAKFQMAKVSVLIVTDVAARGIDIPKLDNVINFNFPATSKLFVHRVGRCARAGRKGIAYSLICHEEYPYLLDLHLFLSRPLNLDTNSKADGVIGRVPQEMCEEFHYQLLVWHKSHTDLTNMKKVCSNAYKKYVRSRPGASVESVRRVKEIDLDGIAVHPAFIEGNADCELELDKFAFLNDMKKYRPKGNIFEIGQASKSVMYTVMKDTRKRNKLAITNHKRKREARETATESDVVRAPLVTSNEEDIANTFQNFVEPRKKKQKIAVDKEHYVPYNAADHHTEQGLSVNNFQHEAEKSQFDLTGDSEDMLKLQQKMMRWDRKKKKMVGVTDVKLGKIRTESGAWIPATYKSNRYSQWKDKTKQADENDDDGDDDEESGTGKQLRGQPHTHWGRHNMKIQQTKGKSELKQTDQVMKARVVAEKKKLKNKKKKGKKKSKKPRRK